MLGEGSGVRWGLGLRALHCRPLAVWLWISHVDSLHLDVL